MHLIKEVLRPESYLPATLAAVSRRRRYETERKKRFKEYDRHWTLRIKICTRTGVCLGVNEK
jgi:hypothetical protein